MKVTQPPASPGRGKRSKGAPPRVRKPAAETSPPIGTKSDGDLSDDARLLESATEVIRTLPGASPERLQELKKSIREGDYAVDASDVAERLVDEHHKTKLDK